MTEVLSGVLPAGTYHQASTLGEGAFGAVVAAFDDDGEAWALKIFAEDEDDGSFDAATVREVSMLRLLRGANGHANILAVHDIRVADSKVVMAMPRLEFDLERAISGRAFVGKKNRVQRVKIAHGVLSAVAFLADNGIMHRDIKCDNVMLAAGTMDPVLIDFSLAKFDTSSGTAKAAKHRAPKAAAGSSARKHSGNVGTATYTAPEVYAGEAYGCGADVWSVGVVLLELTRGEMLGISRDKAAFRAVAALLDALPTDKPMPALLRTLLVVDPAARATARSALAEHVFVRNGLAVPAVRAIDFEHAFAPRGGESCAPSTPPGENAAPKGANRKGAKLGAAAPGTTMEDWCVGARRLVLALGGDLPQPLVRTVAQCAATYMASVASLGLIDGAEDGEYLMHCVVLACKLMGVDEGSVARLAELEGGDEDEDEDVSASRLPLFTFLANASHNYVPPSNY